MLAALCLRTLDAERTIGTAKPLGVRPLGNRQHKSADAGNILTLLPLPIAVGDGCIGGLSLLAAVLVGIRRTDTHGREPRTSTTPAISSSWGCHAAVERPAALGHGAASRRGPVIAVVLTTVPMYVPDLEHPPAYAATLLMAHGSLSSPAQIAAFAVAVVLFVGVHELVGRRLGIWDRPYPRERTGDK